MCEKLYTKSIGRNKILQEIRLKMVQSLSALCVNIWGGDKAFHLFSPSALLKGKQSMVPFEWGLDCPRRQCGHFGGEKNHFSLL